MSHTSDEETETEQTLQQENTKYTLPNEDQGSQNRNGESCERKFEIRHRKETGELLNGITRQLLIHTLF